MDSSRYSTVGSAVSSMFSSPSSSSSVHHASLIDSAAHSPVLLRLINAEISSTVVDHVVDAAVKAVEFALRRSSTGPEQDHIMRPERLTFTEFVNKVLGRARVTMPTLLVALVYIHRVKHHLIIEGDTWAQERILLGSLIVASKYLNDSTLPNVYWALCTGLFGKRDINRMEREFLEVLDFELKVTEEDILNHQGCTTSSESAFY